jgi:hypothetical protein
MDANETNAAQLQRQPMLRSQGPLYPLDTTHLNPANCYVRSYDCHEQCNVNASYNTVSLSIKEKRRKLVTEIATFLGHYSGHWYAQRVRPRDLPKHPLDWSTVLLKRLCGFAQSLPHGITVEQRLDTAHQTMLATEQHPAGPDSAAESTSLHDATEGHPSGLENSAEPVNTHDAKKPTHTSDEKVKLEQLRAHNQRLIDEVQGMREELECEDIIHEIDSHFMREELEELEGDRDIYEIDLKYCQEDLEEAKQALETCRRESLALGSRLSFFENSLSMEELQAMNDLYETSMSCAKKHFGFT